MQKNEREFLLGNLTRGVVEGLVVRKPASGLTVTYGGGLVRVGSGNPTSPVVEKVVAASTIASTTDKDTYLYVNSEGTLSKIEVAQGAAKPTQDDIGLDSEWIAKVVNDDTNVTAITDLRRMASTGELRIVEVAWSFETNEQGAMYALIPFSGRLIAAYASNYKAAGGTDTGTLTAALGVDDVFTNVTGGVMTFAISAAIGTRVECHPTAAHFVRAGNYLRVTSAKTTAGGRGNAYYVFEVAR